MEAESRNRTPLFRQEALNYQTARLQGEVLLKIRSPWLILGFTCAAIATAVIVAAALITYDRKERATGTLVYAEGSANRLEARLRIDPRAIGFVKPGQAVRLRYDAFPARNYGQAPGTILAVSTMPVADGAYVARVALERDYVEAFGERFALRPGMAFTCEIVIEQRSMLEWLFEPLYAMRSRS